MPALTAQEIANHFPEKLYNIESFVLNEQTWDNVRPDLKVLFASGKKYKFDENIRTSLPTTKGIYIFFIEPQFPFNPDVRILMYVGKVTAGDSFNKRFYEYVNSIGNYEPRENIMILTNLWPKHTWVYIYELDLSDAEITAIEDNLIDNIVPPMNNKFKAKSAKNSRSLYL